MQSLEGAEAALEADNERLMGESGTRPAGLFADNVQKRGGSTVSCFKQTLHALSEGSFWGLGGCGGGGGAQPKAKAWFKPLEHAPPAAGRTGGCGNWPHARSGSVLTRWRGCVHAASAPGT
jgi:hypothetical protein